MASRPQIAVAITATDELSGVLDAIKKRMAVAGREAREFGRDLDKSLEKRGLSPGQLGGSVSGAVGRAGMIPGLGALAGAGSIAGIGEIVTRYTSMGVTLGNTARAAGTTAQGLNTLRGSARMLGLSSETADQAMTGLNTTIADAFYGKNPQAAAAFQQFGIGLEGIGGKAKRAEDVLPRIADEVQKIAKVDPRAAVTLMNALGISPEAMPLLLQGAEGLKRYREEVQRLDPITADSVASSQHFTEAMARLGIASDRVGRTIATALEPHLTPMLTQLSNWISGHGPDVGEAFDHLGKAIGGVKWSEVGTNIERVGRDVATVVKDLEDFGARMERVTTNVGNFIHLVQTPGRVFYDALQRGGDIPQVDDMGRPIPGTGGPAPRRNPFFPGEGRLSPEVSSGSGTSQNTNSATKAAFLDKWRPEAERIASRVGTNPDNILAHWAQETGWGTHEHDNNVGNLQAARPGSNTVTRGDTHGDGTAYQAPFFAYKTPAEAAEAYASWVERHGAVGPGAKDSPEAFGGRLREQHYMENPNAPADIAAARRQVERQQAAIPGSDRLAPVPPALAQNNTAPPAATGPAAKPDARQEISDFLTSQLRRQQSTVQIDINHNGAPSGVTMDAKATGAAEVGSIRVARSMPDSGSRRDSY